MANIGDTEYLKEANSYFTGNQAREQLRANAAMLNMITAINGRNNIECNNKYVNALQQFATINNCVTHCNDFDFKRSCNYCNKFNYLMHSE